MKKSFIGDTTRLWNKAPKNIINAKSINSVKKEIRKYSKTLPI